MSSSTNPLTLQFLGDAMWLVAPGLNDKQVPFVLHSADLGQSLVARWGNRDVGAWAWKNYDATGIATPQPLMGIEFASNNQHIDLSLAFPEEQREIIIWPVLAPYDRDVNQNTRRTRWEESWKPFLVKSFPHAMMGPNAAELNTQLTPAGLYYVLRVTIPARMWKVRTRHTEHYRGWFPVTMRMKREGPAQVYDRVWSGGNQSREGQLCWGHSEGESSVIASACANPLDIDKLFFSTVFTIDHMEGDRLWSNPLSQWGLSAEALTGTHLPAMYLTTTMQTRW